MSTPYIPGQRFTSNPEPELGIGRIEALEGRTVTVFFPATQTTRMYEADGAPLERVQLAVGSVAASETGGSFTIDTIDNEDGVLIYCGEGQRLNESQLAASLQVNTPDNRLRALDVDSSADFTWRYTVLEQRHQLRQSAARGFVGARADLIPHQLYIAESVAGRSMPRVLLADEVGLGKTIEACLIIHRLLLTGRAKRVLIVIPDALVHQWFVELLKRFNLSARITDMDYIASRLETDEAANPFADDPLCLCPLSTLRNEQGAGLILGTEWDVAVVDEAHHIDEGATDYQVVKALAERTPGLLLLTATPQQLGERGHFARLHLLDPDRYGDYGTFQQEQSDYQASAALASGILEDAPVNDADMQRLSAVVDTDVLDNFKADPNAGKMALINQWLDRHGTGRVMFRNTRKVIKGFPKRLLQRHDLANDGEVDASKAVLREFRHDTGLDADRPRYAWRDDPRIAWLLNWLNANPKQKLFLICTTKEKVIAIDRAIQGRFKGQSALFHEDFSLMERDRNAAFFADPDGAQVLIASEIGGEGRNFQFAHHLVLFDIPLNPELLEQRIGRLDRIGQREDINIHVPVLAQSPQAAIATWYHDGINAFEKSVSGAAEIMAPFKADLMDLAQAWAKAPDKADPKLADFIAKTRKHYQTVEASLNDGRDRLLELSSFRAEQAADMVTCIQDLDDAEEVDDFMLQAWETFGIDAEETGFRTYHLRPEITFNDEFPHFDLRGMHITFDRTEAIRHDRLHFITWDHPMVNAVMELMLSREKGNCSLALWPDDEPGFFLEAVFVLETLCDERLHADRVLPPTPVRVLLDVQGQDQADEYEPDVLRFTLKDLPARMANALPDHVWETIVPSLMKQAEEASETRAQLARQHAIKRLKETLVREVQRLEALAKHNPAIRDVEIQALRDEVTALADAIKGSRLRLDSLRLIVRQDLDT